MIKWRALAVCLITSTVCAQPASAGCLLLNITALLREPHYALVFRGTAVDIRRMPDGQIVTFRVTRVWKGDAGPAVVIYSWLPRENRNSESGFDVPFEAGQEYLVSAHRHSRAEREAFGLPPSTGPDSFGISDGAHSCVTSRSDSTEAQTMLAGAPPGRPPR
jgi:hypothetical protein